MAVEAARLMIRVGADTGDAERGLSSINDRLNNVAKSAGMMGTVLTAGVTLPLLAVAKSAVQSAGDFEQSLNITQQILGATQTQMESMSAAAIQWGADSVFGAGEIADAMQEGAKAGLDYQQVMDAMPGVIDMAAASGEGLAASFGTMAAAMNTFGLNASESTNVANMFAAASNASAASMTDLAQGMQQAGFAFAAANQDLPDLLTSLAILTNVGLTGSDAGTALKNAMMRLMDPTEEAKGVMNELGISVYDAQGNMLAMPAIIDEFNTGMAGLTQEQRNAALTTILLSDGFKAFGPLLEAGSAGFLEMRGSVNEAGAASKVAEAAMKGLNGGIEQMMGSLESLRISKAKPFLNFLGDGFRAIGRLIDAFGRLPQPVVNAALAFAGVLAAAGPVLVAIGAIAGALAFLLTPVGAVIAITAALAAAWAGNFGGIREVTQGVLDQLATFAPVVDAVGAAASVLWAGLTGQGDAATVMTQLDQIEAAFGTDIRNAVSDAGLTIAGWRETVVGHLDAVLVKAGAMLLALQGMTPAELLGEAKTIGVSLAAELKTKLTIAWSEVSVNTQELVGRVQANFDTIDWTQMRVDFSGLLSRAAERLRTQSEIWFGKDNLVGRTLDTLEGMFTGLGETFAGISLDDPLSVLTGTVDALMGIWGAIGTIKADATTTAITGLQTLITAVLDFATKLTNDLDTTALAETATNYVNTISAQVQTAFATPPMEEIGTSAGAFISSIIGKLTELFGSETFGTDLGTAVGAGTAAFVQGALALAAGIATELGNVPWTDFLDSLSAFSESFLSSFGTEVAKGDYKPLAQALLEGTAKALWEVVRYPITRGVRDTQTVVDEIQLQAPYQLLPDEAAFQWPPLPTELTGWGWPNLPTWNWPNIPVPDWLGGFFDRADDIERRMDEFNRSGGGDSGDTGGGGGGGGGGNPYDDISGGTNFPKRLPQNRLAMAGGTTINVYATVANDLDINELALRIAQAQRRRG